LKPGVTFFGGVVPEKLTAAARAAVETADAMLIIGSSVQVFSAFRLVRAAAQQSLPIAILNNGETRADKLATLKIAGDAADVLTRVCDELALRATNVWETV
jgi:NAD-dependent SIR2 family protein deacetylase